MRGYAKIALVSILMMGLLAVPNLSPATDGSSNRDGNGRHRLLNAELRSKVEHLRNKIVEHREHQHNQGGIPGTLEALQARVTSLETALAKLTALPSAPPTSGGSVDPVLVELAKYVTVTPAAEMRFGLKGPHVIFHGANVHVQSGSGTTFEAGGATGRGNLIVGYNEGNGLLRVGSHNLVVGPSHTFTSTGGVVFGDSNLISAQSAAVLGGLQNKAEGERSSILGTAGYTIQPLYPETTFP